jgi:hypothetical protein
MTHKGELTLAERRLLEIYQALKAKTHTLNAPKVKIEISFNEGAGQISVTEFGHLTLTE